jgi:predicted permease
VLLLILTNLANLLLVRATTRQRELAIRQAMGAGRWRLIRQLLTETLLLGLLGGLGGAILALWGIDLFIGFLPRSFLPIFRELRLETNALLFAMLLAILSSIIFGLFPSFQLSGRENCHETLKTEGRIAGTTHGHQRLRNALVVAETALATVLLISAGLCLKSFQNARQANFGFDPRNVLLAPVGICSGDVGEVEVRNYYRRLLEAVRPIPSVVSACSSNWMLLGRQGTQNTYIAAEQYQPKPGENMAFPYAVISTDYFKTLKIPLLEGRDFTEADGLQAPGAVLINKTMAQRLWPGQMAVGRHLFWGKRGFQVIGVAGNSKYSLPEEPALPFMFFHLLQVHGGGRILYVQTTGDPASLIRPLEKLIQSLDPNFHLFNPLPMTQHLEITVVNQPIAAQILMALGILALLLAALGIYGVLAFIVAQRTREIGVRMALGAAPAAILRMVMRQGLKFILAGIVLGVLLAFILSRHFAGLLWDVRPFDPIIYTSVVLFFALVGSWACYLPARHATRVDPIVALHRE